MKFGVTKGWIWSVAGMMLAGAGGVAGTLAYQAHDEKIQPAERLETSQIKAEPAPIPSDEPTDTYPYEEETQHAYGEATQPPPYDYHPMDEYISFETPYAESVVRNFNIACPQAGKSIALMDVLRRAEREGTQNSRAKLYTTVDSRETDVRIYHQVILDNGESNSRRVVMTLNKWDEIHFVGIRKEAVMLLCYVEKI